MKRTRHCDLMRKILCLWERKCIDSKLIFSSLSNLSNESGSEQDSWLDKSGEDTTIPWSISPLLQNLEGSIRAPLDVNKAKTKTISCVLEVTSPTIGNGSDSVFDFKIVWRVLTMLGGTTSGNPVLEIIRFCKTSAVIWWVFAFSTSKWQAVGKSRQ